MFDYIVVGAGLAGTVLARKIAEELDKKVLVIEKRGHIAGNMYDRYVNGILVQEYGPHFFATYQWWIIDYLSQYAEFYECPIKAVSYVDGQYIARPYNFRTLQQLVGPENSQPVLEKLREEFPAKHRVTLSELMSSKSSEISDYGKLLYDKVYAPYIAKQWGLKVEEIDPEVVNRSEIVLGYEEQLVDWDFQYLPSNGYTALIRNMLEHPNIQICLNTDALEYLTLDDDKKEILYKQQTVKGVIYTGEINELFRNRFGLLPYRSRYFELNQYDEEKILPCGVVTYPKENEYIRKTEFKQFNPTKKDSTGTIVQSEFSLPYDRKAVKGNEPYYPIINSANTAVYDQYKELAVTYHNLFLCGRLAEYKYYDMDKVIMRAFEVFESVKGEKNA